MHHQLPEDKEYGVTTSLPHKQEVSCMIVAVTVIRVCHGWCVLSSCLSPHGDPGRVRGLDQGVFGHTL